MWVELPIVNWAFPAHLSTGREFTAAVYHLVELIHERLGLGRFGRGKQVSWADGSEALHLNSHLFTCLPSVCGLSSTDPAFPRLAELTWLLKCLLFQTWSMPASSWSCTIPWGIASHQQYVHYTGPLLWWGGQRSLLIGIDTYSGYRFALSSIGLSCTVLFLIEEHISQQSKCHSGLMPMQWWGISPSFISHKRLTYLKCEIAYWRCIQLWGNTLKSWGSPWIGWSIYFLKRRWFCGPVFSIARIHRSGNQVVSLRVVSL